MLQKLISSLTSGPGLSRLRPQGPGPGFRKPVPVEDYTLVPADLVPGGASLCFSHDEDLLLSSWGETMPHQG